MHVQPLAGVLDACLLNGTVNRGVSSDAGAITCCVCAVSTPPLQCPLNLYVA
jgi:hypothetical protein